jgi:hypothetical protein
MQYSVAFYYFSLRSKYSPQHLVLMHVHLCPSLKGAEQASDPHKTGEAGILYISTLWFLDKKHEEQIQSIMKIPTEIHPATNSTFHQNVLWQFWLVTALYTSQAYNATTTCLEKKKIVHFYVLGLLNS